MARPVYFELTATDPERAARFYQSVFGWETTLRDGPGEFWSMVTGPDGEPGINGGMRRRMPGEPPGVVNNLYVASVDDTLVQVRALGGRVIVPPFVVPGVCRIAYAADPDGNPFAVVEPAPQDT